MNGINEAFAAMAGQDIPGGCDTCDAYQRMAEHPDMPGVWTCGVYHDDHCPTLASRRASR